MPDAGPGTRDALSHLILKTLLRATHCNYTCCTDEETGSERLSYQLRMHSSQRVELDLKPESPPVNLDFRKHREGLCRGQTAGVIRVGFGLLRLLCWAQPWGLNESIYTMVSGLPTSYRQEVAEKTAEPPR